MIDINELARLHAAADKDNTVADEYRMAVDAALPELLAEVEELRRDKERLEFAISTLNEMQMFGDWCEQWHPTLCTSEERATDKRWRAAIDAARGGKP